MTDVLLEFLVERAGQQPQASSPAKRVPFRKPVPALRPLFELIDAGQWPTVDLGYTVFDARHFDTFETAFDSFSVDLDHAAGSFRGEYGAVLAKTRDGGSVIGLQWDPKANKRGGYRWVDVFVAEQSIASYSGEQYVDWLRDIERDMVGEGGYTSDFRQLMKAAKKRPKKI